MFVVRVPESVATGTMSVCGTTYAILELKVCARIFSFLATGGASARDFWLQSHQQLSARLLVVVWQADRIVRARA